MIYEIPICDNDGHVFAEIDASLKFDVSLFHGEPLVELQSFVIKAKDGCSVTFDASLPDSLKKTIFLNAKKRLEQDDDFLNAALDEDDSIHFIGKGPLDPDGYFQQDTMEKPR